MSILNILLYIILIYFIIKMMFQKKATKRISKVVDLIKLVENEEEYINKAQEEINAATTVEEKTRFEVLKLWGEVYHLDYSEFDSLVENMDLDSLLNNSKQNNDDSYFYYFLAIPNLLQADNQIDKIHTLMNKVGDTYKNRLDYALAVACNKYYENSEDKGKQFFENLLEGNYEEYTYYRQLIGLYKQIAGTMLTMIYKDVDLAKYEEMYDLAKSFYETRIGTKWINNIHLEMNAEDKHVEESSDDQVMDAEIVDEKEIEDSVETGDSFLNEEDETK